MPRSSALVVRFWSIVLAIVVLDVITKVLAEQFLLPQYVPRQVIGDVVQLRLVYNPGAAFGLYLGPHSRWIFMGLTIGALWVLWQLYRTTRPSDTPRLLALSLVCAGALGNLVDRIRSERGVVDFIDVGLGDMRWPTFNVADMAVSVGAFMLAWVLWGEDAESEKQAAAAGEPPERSAESGGRIESAPR